MASIKNIYVCTRSVRGIALHIFRKNELYEKSISDEGNDYVFLNLCDPGFEAYDDLEIDVFKKCFRQLDVNRDKNAIFNLSKWKVIDLSKYQNAEDIYYTFEVTAQNGALLHIYDIKKIIAKSPRQAILIYGFNKDRIKPTFEIVRGKIWVAKQWTDSYCIAMKENKILDRKRILELIKKYNSTKNY